MKLTIGTLSGVLVDGGRICDLLTGVNTGDTVKRLREVMNDPGKLAQLMSALDRLEKHCCEIRAATLEGTG